MVLPAFLASEGTAGLLSCRRGSLLGGDSRRSAGNGGSAGIGGRDLSGWQCPGGDEEGYRQDTVRIRGDIVASGSAHEALSSRSVSRRHVFWRNAASILPGWVEDIFCGPASKGSAGILAAALAKRGREGSAGPNF